MRLSGHLAPSPLPHYGSRFRWKVVFSQRVYDWPAQTEDVTFAVPVAPGLGWGLVFTPMLATVMAHFTRRRTLALGISLSSVGLSSFAFNPFFQLLVDKYSWRGAILILGGLSLNLVPCGALIRPRRRSEAPVEVRGALIARCCGSVGRD